MGNPYCSCFCPRSPYLLLQTVSLILSSDRFELDSFCHLPKTLLWQSIRATRSSLRNTF
ncbi:hypothetical protein OIU78_017958 [Salix suchowensis]|nr:hypothetical protein OIU78_017958 [Salix suchowensis]